MIHPSDYQKATKVTELKIERGLLVHPLLFKYPT